MNRRWLFLLALPLASSSYAYEYKVVEWPKKATMGIVCGVIKDPCEAETCVVNHSNTLDECEDLAFALNEAYRRRTEQDTYITTPSSGTLDISPFFNDGGSPCSDETKGCLGDMK